MPVVGDGKRSPKTGQLTDSPSQYDWIPVWGIDTWVVLSVHDSGKLKSGKFFAVPVEDLLRGTATGFDLHVRTRDGHSPYLHSGQRVTDSTRHALEQSGISKLYVPGRIAVPFARSYFEAAQLVLESRDASSEDRAQ